ncbi:synaptotagmin-like protein 2 isoform X2 [Hippoglossus hippoglossus]|uniref:synaptotagmin-like protein 2 isoform X2 n=1 Tax=Hippoglossus hippoglossus TaxID=8267 RepID=UPI00148D995F|nr:synaptotagmin-like protein 2 isoform X2 [Hippoglossus hippoglossus]
MIDLSYLTEEEQETILAVLKRDAELKKADEHRVLELQRRVSDTGQLRYLTGEWFYETKQLRHQDRIHGSDIIRASMRHTHKPLTILELSQILPEQSSFVSSENKEVFVPPVLCGLLQEPHPQLSSGSRYHNQNPYDPPPDTQKPVVQSPTKQRKNPFNSDLNAHHFFEDQNSQLLAGEVDQTQKQNEVWTNCESRYFTNQCVFEHCHPELLGPAVSSFVSAEQVQGKPAHLETEPEEERHSQAQPTDWPTRHNIHHQNLPEQSTDISVDATSDTTPPNSVSSGSLSHAVSPQPRQRLLGIFRRQKMKIAEVQSPQKEGILIQEKEPGTTPNLSLSATDTTMDKTLSVTHEAKPTEMTEVRTLQLAALQNTSFEETVATVDEDTATEGKAERLSNLKAFWERENTGPKIKFLREDKSQGDISKTGADTSHGPKTYVDSLNNILAQNDTIDDTAGRSQENILLPQTECSLLVVLSNEDGTYRANPVLIYEDTDDSLTGSVTESQEILPVCSSLAFNAPKQQEGVPVSLPRQSSSSPLENRPAKITELENLWQTEYTGPTENTAIVKNASSSSILGAKMVSTQSDQRTFLDNIAKSEGEEPKSPCKTNLKVTDKGFVTQSPERPQLRGSGSAGDAQSTCHQQPVKADAESQQRPLSPSKSQMSRSMDQDEEVRMSPSKTCHPRVLPRESSSPMRSRLEDSPLKTFSIDINPQTTASEEQQRKPSPVPRQRKSPSHGAKQTALTDNKPSTDIPSCPLPLHAEDREDYYDNINTQQSNSSSSNSPQSKLRTFTRLARSFIPQDYQHYLGPQKMAHVPPFHQEKEVAGENDAEHRTQSFLRDFVGNQSDNSTVGNRPRSNSWIVQNKDRNSCQDTTTRACSLSRASSGSYDESPIRSALKRLSSRMSSSKSLENLTSQPREEMTKHESRQQIVDDVSSLPPSASTLSNSKQKKTSVSVPVLQQDETDSDSTFETNLGWRRNTGSSTSNISLSSGMASMSSVSGSTSSIFPGDLGDIEVQGNIQFAVNYIQKLGEFHIFVVHCRELAVADTKKSRSDPYVKCYLLPDKTKLGKRKTTVKKKTFNPNYNEILRFKIIIEALKTQNLNVSVWHNDTFGRNSFLGEVDLDLSEWDFSNTQINEYTLKSRVMSAQSSNHPSPSHLMDSSGQMRVALRFLPQTSHSKRTSRMETGEVQIWVKDCKNLPSVRGVIIDPFVKCTVLPDTSRKSRQKTRVVKRTANPMFNHTMVYDGFRTEDLREACVEITVWDHDRMSSHYIGGLRLGLGTGKSYGVEVVWMDSTAAEADLWQRMLESDGEWVEDVLPLKMFVLAKSTSK